MHVHMCFQPCFTSTSDWRGTISSWEKFAFVLMFLLSTFDLSGRSDLTLFCSCCRGRCAVSSQRWSVRPLRGICVRRPGRHRPAAGLRRGRQRGQKQRPHAHPPAGSQRTPGVKTLYWQKRTGPIPQGRFPSNATMLSLRALKLLIPLTCKAEVSESGMSPLHSAAAGGHWQCLKVTRWLVMLFSTSVSDANGVSPNPLRPYWMRVMNPTTCSSPGFAGATTTRGSRRSFSPCATTTWCLRSCCWRPGPWPIRTRWNACRCLHACVLARM